MRIFIALQGALLRIAPRAFRVRFTAELVDVARRALEEERREHGARAAFALGCHQTLDVAGSVLRLNLESRARSSALSLLGALGTAALVGWVDVHASEVQPAVFLLVSGGTLLVALAPLHALRAWLVLGLSVPAAHLVARAAGHRLPYDVGHFAETFLALVPAGIGVLLGLFIGRSRARGRDGGLTAAE